MAHYLLMMRIYAKRLAEVTKS